MSLSELDISPLSPSDVAKKWAAVEAFSKALGTGIRGFRPTDITISHSSLGKPTLSFNENVIDILSSKGITSSHLSLSDEKDHVIAFVTLEK